MRCGNAKKRSLSTHGFYERKTQDFRSVIGQNIYRRNDTDTKMKASFLRKRKMTRAVLVLDASLGSLEPHLRSKNFHVVTMPAGELDTDGKVLLLCHRTLITRTPQAFEYDVTVLEYSLIDVSGVTSDDATLADIISLAWTRFRLKSEGWFILLLRQDGDHRIKFPE